MHNKYPQLAVSIALRHSENGAFLLVKRGHAPAKGLWAFAGGRVSYGETLSQAALRELKEETGLTCNNISFFTHVELIPDDAKTDTHQNHYLLCVHRGKAQGTPIAADDADEARWVSIEEFDTLSVTQSTRNIAHLIIKNDL